MKSLEQMAPGDLVYEISASDLIMSTGILLAKWASDITFTDAAYSNEWINETAEIMATHSEVLHDLFTNHLAVLQTLVVKPSSEITGTVSVNPFRKNSMTGKNGSVDPSIPSAEGNEPSIGDVPF